MSGEPRSVFPTKLRSTVEVRDCGRSSAFREFLSHSFLVLRRFPSSSPGLSTAAQTHLHRRSTPIGGSNGGVLVGHTSGRFTVTANLAIGRAGHTATLLPDGSVLVAGAGQLDIDDLLVSFASTEILSPSGQVSSAASLTTPREFHTATLLQSGKILITGGNVFSGYPTWLPGTSSAELYDPAVGKSTQISDMSTSRTGHTASLLADGRVLIFGGAVSGLPSAEVYDPAEGNFTVLPNPVCPRAPATQRLFFPQGRC